MYGETKSWQSELAKTSAIEKKGRQITMLYTKLLHPPILKALASAGHGSKILLADANYPLSTHTYPHAERVYLNLSPGLLAVTDMLAALLTAIPVEAARVMQTDDGSEPPIYTNFRSLLPELELQKVARAAFYDLARQDDVALVIASGEQRLYANLILTIGVVKPE